MLQEYEHKELNGSRWERPERSSNTNPLLSIIIPVYNDWDNLAHCLDSLDGQDHSSLFEVILVDDGSLCPVPQKMSDRFSGYSFPVFAIRQEHAGVSTARNRALGRAVGQVFLFVDADCILDVNCIHSLETALEKYPDDDSFQLRITGGTEDIVGTAETLHLSAVQSQRLSADGHILYMNTSGMAIRRRRTDLRRGLFRAGALRAQDSFLLAELLADGTPPRFVSEAIVTHAVNLSLLQYLAKGLRTGYTAEQTYMLIDAMRVTIRASLREQCSMLTAMAKQLPRRPNGGAAICVVLLRRVLNFVGAAAFRLWHPKLNVHELELRSSR
jgi:glycosyltransferase involved in cell wall biosynthesis